MTSSVPLDDLDASLGDFEPPDSPLPPHSASVTTAGTDRESLAAEEDRAGEDSDSASAGGYSPPAWRRLDNGDRSSGFWRGGRDILGAVPLRLDSPRGTSPERSYGDSDYGDDGELDDSEDEDVLERAIRTRLPAGSMSPEKGISVSPERQDEDRTLRAGDMGPAAGFDRTPSPPPDNCMCIWIYFSPFGRNDH